jgi:PIN domain nuclease of toxin-antitoxin system
MILAIADTHAVLWYLYLDERLPGHIRLAMRCAAELGGKIGVSSISLAEVVYLCEKGRIAADAYEVIEAALADGVFEEIPVDGNVVRKMIQIPRAQIPELPDRIVAATALLHSVPVITRDSRIAASLVETLW